MFQKVANLRHFDDTEAIIHIAPKHFGVGAAESKFQKAAQFIYVEAHPSMRVSLLLGGVSYSAKGQGDRNAWETNL